MAPVGVPDAGMVPTHLLAELNRVQSKLVMLNPAVPSGG